MRRAGRGATFAGLMARADGASEERGGRWRPWSADVESRGEGAETTGTSPSRQRAPFPLPRRARRLQRARATDGRSAAGGGGATANRRLGDRGVLRPAARPAGADGGHRGREPRARCSYRYLSAPLMIEFGVAAGVCGVVLCCCVLSLVPSCLLVCAGVVAAPVVVSTVPRRVLVRARELRRPVSACAVRATVLAVAAEGFVEHANRG